MILSEKSPINKITIFNELYKNGFISINIEYVNKKKSSIILRDFLDYHKILKCSRNYIKIKKI